MSGNTHAPFIKVIKVKLDLCLSALNATEALSYKYALPF